MGVLINGMNMPIRCKFLPADLKGEIAMRDLTELNKLEDYLKSKDIPYERVDEDETWAGPHIVAWERHQITVTDSGAYKWDAICHRGSYGAEEGLLEIMGSIVRKTDKDRVVGWLTADDVIKRIEAEE